jgi:hypothetical protein
MKVHLHTMHEEMIETHLRNLALNILDVQNTSDVHDKINHAKKQIINSLVKDHDDLFNFEEEEGDDFHLAEMDRPCTLHPSKKWNA